MAGPACVLSAVVKKAPQKEKSPSLYIFMSRVCATTHLPATPNLEANVFEQN